MGWRAISGILWITVVPALAAPTKPPDLDGAFIWPLAQAYLQTDQSITRAVGLVLMEHDLSAPIVANGWRYLLSFEASGVRVPLTSVANHFFSRSIHVPEVQEPLLRWMNDRGTRNALSERLALGWIGNTSIPEVAREAAWRHLMIDGVVWLNPKQSLGPTQVEEMTRDVLNRAGLDLRVGSGALETRVRQVLTLSRIRMDGPAPFNQVLEGLRARGGPMLEHAVIRAISLLMPLGAPTPLQPQERQTLLDRLEVLVRNVQLPEELLDLAMWALPRNVAGRIYVERWLTCPDEDVRRWFGFDGVLPGPFLERLTQETLTTRERALAAGREWSRMKRLLNDVTPAALEFLDALGPTAQNPGILRLEEILAFFDQASVMLDANLPPHRTTFMRLPRFVSLPPNVASLINHPDATLVNLVPLLAYPQEQVNAQNDAVEIRAAWTAILRRATLAQFQEFFRQALAFDEHPLREIAEREFIARGFVGGHPNSFNPALLIARIRHQMARPVRPEVVTDADLQQMAAWEQEVHAAGFGRQLPEAELSDWWAQVMRLRGMQANLTDGLLSPWDRIRLAAIPEVHREILGGRASPELIAAILSERLNPDRSPDALAAISSLVRSIADRLISVTIPRDISALTLSLIRSEYPEFWIAAAVVLTHNHEHMPEAAFLAQELLELEATGEAGRRMLNSRQRAAWQREVPDLERLAQAPLRRGTMRPAPLWSAQQAAQNIWALAEARVFTPTAYIAASQVIDQYPGDITAQRAFALFTHGYAAANRPLCVALGIREFSFTHRQ